MSIYKINMAVHVLDLQLDLAIFDPMSKQMDK